MLNIKKFAHEYNIMKPKIDHVSEFECLVRQLDENEELFNITVARDCCGQWLLDEVCEKLGGIKEKDYFGLRYTDKDKQRQWLDLGKNTYSQIKDSQKSNSDKIVVNFRIKHYPASPFEDLKQDIARYCLYLQLRRDLYGGRLLGKSGDLYQLAAYAVQSELGDFESPKDDKQLSDLKLLQNLNSKTEAKITEIHKTLAGLSQVEAERKFLQMACQLDTYGVEPFFVKDQKGNNLYVGLTHEGVSTFQGSRRAHLFKWADILKIHYQGKLFIIQVMLDEIVDNHPTQKKHVLGFKCETMASSCALWKWANDRKYFFSLVRSSQAKRVKSGGGIFKKRKTFKFSGRCQQEILDLSVSMIELNDQGSDRLFRRNTLARSDATEDYSENQSKYNSMPSRDRGKLLGTQDTLDSLFMINQNGSHSPILSPIGSPKSEPKFCNAATQSLENITEEPHILPFENIEQYSASSLLLDIPKGDRSINSSAKSSTLNLSSNPDISLKRRVSEINKEICVALEELQMAVTDSVDYALPPTANRSIHHGFAHRLICLGCVMLFAFFLALLVLMCLLVLTRHYRQESGSYDFLRFLSDIVSHPSRTVDLIQSEQLTEMARNCFLTVSDFLSTSPKKR